MKCWTRSGSPCIHGDFPSFGWSDASFWFHSPPSVRSESCPGIFACYGLYVIISVILVVQVY